VAKPLRGWKGNNSPKTKGTGMSDTNKQAPPSNTTSKDCGCVPCLVLDREQKICHDLMDLVDEIKEDINLHMDAMSELTPEQRKANKSEFEHYVESQRHRFGIIWHRAGTQRTCF
jgi:hypothetical protein